MFLRLDGKYPHCRCSADEVEREMTKVFVEGRESFDSAGVLISVVSSFRKRFVVRVHIGKVFVRVLYVKQTFQVSQPLRSPR